MYPPLFSQCATDLLATAPKTGLLSKPLRQNSPRNDEAPNPRPRSLSRRRPRRWCGLRWQAVCWEHPSATSTYAHDTNYDLEDIFLPLPLRYHYCDHDGLGWAKPGHAGCQAMPAYDEGRQRLPKRRCCRTTTISVTSSAIIAALTGLFAYYAPLA